LTRREGEGGDGANFLPEPERDKEGDKKNRHVQRSGERTQHSGKKGGLRILDTTMQEGEKDPYFPSGIFHRGEKKGDGRAFRRYTKKEGNLLLDSPVVV